MRGHGDPSWRLKLHYSRLSECSSPLRSAQRDPAGMGLARVGKPEIMTKRCFPWNFTK